MKKLLLIALLFSGVASANTTYMKCSYSEGQNSYTGMAASFSMSQGEGGFDIDGMSFMSTQNKLAAGDDGDIEKDDKGDVLTLLASRTLQEQPIFKYEQDLKVVKADGSERVYTCANLPDDLDIQRLEAMAQAQGSAPASGSGGNCDSYYGVAADGSQCGLRSRDSRVRPY